MKRVSIAIAAVLMIAAAALVWSFGGNVTAQDDDVAALQTQVADLDGRVSALEAAATVPAIVASPAPTVTRITGEGDQAVVVGVLPAGPYVLRGTFAEAGDVMIWLVATDAGTADTFQWRLDVPGEAWRVFVVGSGDGEQVLEVHASGAWEIEISPVP